MQNGAHTREFDASFFQTVSDSGGRGRLWGGGRSDQKVHYYVVNLIPVCFLDTIYILRYRHRQLRRRQLRR